MAESPWNVIFLIHFSKHL